MPKCFACSRANAPCVLTSQRALRADVLTYQLISSHFLRSCVLTCSRVKVLYMLSCSCVNIPYLLIYSRVNVACGLTCSRVNMPWVPCLTRLPWSREHLPTYLTSSVSSFDAIFFSFTAIVVKVVHTVGKV